MSRHTRVIQVRPVSAPAQDAAGMIQALSDSGAFHPYRVGRPAPFGEYMEDEHTPADPATLAFFNERLRGFTRVQFTQRGPFDDLPVREAAVTFRQPTRRVVRNFQHFWAPYSRVSLVNRVYKELCVDSWGEPLDPVEQFRFRERALYMFFDALAADSLD